MEAKKNKTELKKASIMEILKPKDAPAKLRTVKVSSELFSQYFNEEQSQEEVNDIMAKALAQYFSDQNH